MISGAVDLIKEVKERFGAMGIELSDAQADQLVALEKEFGWTGQSFTLQLARVISSWGAEDIKTLGIPEL